MTRTRTTLFTASVALSIALLGGAYLFGSMDARYGKEWGAQGMPSVLHQFAYLLALLAVGLAFTGRGWWRVLGVMLGLFTLVCWINTAFHE